MNNDPNDRFMISDLSSKLSAYINNEYTEKTPLKDSARIEDALSSEIIPEAPERKVPGDELFNDLNQALDSQHSAKMADEERQQRFIEEHQRKLQEEQEKKKLQAEQLKKREQEEVYKRELLKEEEKIKAEKEKKRSEERALSRFSEKNMYGFSLDQPYESIHSGHKMSFTPLPKVRKAMTVEEELTSVPAEPEQSTPPEVPAAPQNNPAVPEEEIALAAPKKEPLEEPVIAEEPSEMVSTPKKEKEQKEGGPFGVVIIVLISLAVIIALIILIRTYLPGISGLTSGTPAQGTSQVTTSSQAVTDTEQESTASVVTEEASSAAEATEESGIGMTAWEDESVALEIPEDPNDIAYIASMNEKAADHEIAALDAASPRLYLSSYGLKISAGTRFNALSYVEDVEDDSDSKDRLYSDISVDGLSEMSANVPGTYELVFYCYDSSGNRSNRAKMTVIVE